MPVLKSDVLREISFSIFARAGADDNGAQIVADHLVENNLMGHYSHGVIQISNYFKWIQEGFIIPKAKPKISHETASTAIVDGQWGIGQVVAQQAMEIAIGKAKRNSVAVVTTSRCNHIGRIGAYPQMAAAHQMIGIASVNNGGGAQAVAPYGGIARRITPNPISIALPRLGKEPIILDISTSVVAEGKVRVKAHRHENIPEGWIINSEGHPSTNPLDYYGPPEGSLLPFGGMVGYKGFGLGFVLDILSGALSGAGCSRPGDHRPQNGVFFTVINIESFLPVNEFKDQVDGLVGYVKSSPPAPGFSDILVPGEAEFREKKKRSVNGIFVEDETWNQICKIAKELEIEVPQN